MPANKAQIDRVISAYRELIAHGKAKNTQKEENVKPNSKTNTSSQNATKS